MFCNMSIAPYKEIELIFNSKRMKSSFWQAVDTAPCEGVSNFDILFFSQIRFFGRRINRLHGVGVGWGGVGHDDVM